MTAAGRLDGGPAATRWGIVALLFCAGLLAAAQFAKISLALPELAGHFDRPVERVAVLVSLASVAGVVLGALAGGLVARAGLRAMLLWALALGGGLSLLQAALPDFGAFFLSRLLEGLSHLVIVVAAPTAISAAARTEDQPVVMGIWGMFFGVSFAIAAQVMPPLLDLGGLPLPLAAHGGALLILAGLLGLRMPPVPAARREGRAGVIGEHRAVYGSLRTAAPALLFLWHTLCFVALLSFVPAQVGWGGTAFALISLAGTFLAGLLARRIAPLRLAAAAFVGSLAIAGALAAFPAATPLLALYFLSNGMIPGASFAAVPALNTTTVGRARANGALAQLGNVGTALGTPFFALTLAHGLTGLMALAAVLALCGALLAVVIHRKLGHAT